MSIDTPAELRRAIRRLPERAPLTENFEAQLSAGAGSSKQVWYRSQKEHWLGWLGAYDGPGYYGRQRWDRSAAFVYNHIVCPPMVLWLGEAAGLSGPTIKTAAREALRARPSLSARCGAIRRVMRWDDVHQALVRR